MGNYSCGMEFLLVIKRIYKRRRIHETTVEENSMKRTFDFTRLKNLSNNALYTEVPPIGYKEQIGLISLPRTIFDTKPPRHISITITWKE